MKKCIFIFIFALAHFNSSFAAIPAGYEGVLSGPIACPSQDNFDSWQPERIDQTKIRYWFGGKHHLWTPMSLVIGGVVPPFKHNTKATIEPRSITLSQDKSGDWIISCTYKAAGGFSSGAENFPVTHLTIPGEVKSCKLNKTTDSVSCK